MSLDYLDSISSSTFCVNCLEVVLDLLGEVTGSSGVTVVAYVTAETCISKHVEAARWECERFVNVLGLNHFITDYSWKYLMTVVHLYDMTFLDVFLENLVKLCRLCRLEFS